MDNAVLSEQEQYHASLVNAQAKHEPVDQSSGDEMDLPVEEALPAEGQLTDRHGDLWQMWYRRGLANTMWFKGTCLYDHNAETVSFVKAKIMFDEELGFLKATRIMSTAAYQDNMDTGLFSEIDPVPEEGYESPRRRESNALAAAQQKVLGEKRVETKYRLIKNVLEVGDVLRLPISFKHRHRSGDTNIPCLVHKVLPRQCYQVLTHVGPLTMKVPRSDLIFMMDTDQALLGIHPSLGELPPITEANALKILNPMRNDGVFCKCKNVSKVHCYQCTLTSSK